MHANISDTDEIMGTSMNQKNSGNTKISEKEI